MMNHHSSMNAAINQGINSAINASIMSDDMSEPSSPEDTGFDDSDLLHHVHDDVTSQLIAAGPIGVAAAAAIATGKKRKRPHSFETNPSIRKRQQTRLQRKLKATIEEYTTRVGQQAIVLSVTPGKSSTSSQSFKVFGSQPLENVMRACRSVIMQELDQALAQQTPAAQPENAALHELPPLNIDGIPTPVDKMTQAQLRAFIPEMLKYSTGRSKPGWGKHEYRPVWWPDDVPWANVRSDVRTDDQKKAVSWTHALRTIVKNCYKHHGREDLLPDFHDAISQQQAMQAVTPFGHQTMVQTINNPDGTMSIIQIDTGDVHPQMVTLADGTQAQVVQITNGPHHSQHEATQAVQTLAEVASNQHEVVSLQQQTPVSVEMNEGATHAVATLNADGQIILTGDTSSLTGMVTIPVSVYQTVVTSMGQQAVLDQHGNELNTGALTIADPEQLEPKSEVMGPVVQVMDMSHHHQHKSHNGEVPDATQAVEVITVEPAS